MTDLVLGVRPEFTPDSPLSETYRAYADYVRGLLHGGRSQWLFNDANTTDNHLFIYDEPAPSAWPYWSGRPATARVVAHSSGPVLIARQPRWPFRRLLLALRDERSDLDALNWTMRLARPSQAAVTVLPVLPPAPNFLAVSDDRRGLLTSLITSDSRCGRRLRQIQAALVAAGIDHEFSLQPGPPESQIAAAVDLTDAELLLMGGDATGRLWRWLTGPLWPLVLHWLDRPLLVANC